MDSDYIERQNATDFNRRTYFTIVNGAAVNENHVLKENIQLWTCIQQHWQL